MEFAIFGAGRAAHALGYAMVQAGHQCLGIWARRLESAQSLSRHLDFPALWTLKNFDPNVPLLLLAVSDRAIEEVARLWADKISDQTTVLHLSGALPSQILKHAGLKGPVGSMHPIQSLTGIGDRFQGRYMGIEGDPKAVLIARKICESLDAYPMVFTQRPSELQKALYHSSAVVLSNGLVALWEASLQLIEGSGLSRTQGASLLLPLLESTVEHLKAVREQTTQALTGPASRGDSKIMEHHQKAMELLQSPREVQALYDALQKIWTLMIR